MLSKDAAVYDNSTLSTVIRCHQRERLPLLEEAVFSLALQHWRDIELIIVLQNGTDEIVREVERMVTLQPWPGPPSCRVLSENVPDGVDGRSALLNRGIAEATGRFLAFLDDDDVVYQHGYATLIEQLERSEYVIAIGGCRAARIQFSANHWFVKTKYVPFGWGRSRLDIFRQNFVPIHSYVIDRSRLGSFELYFDDKFSLLEDYDFLLRLCAKFDVDFAKLDVPVAEYRMRDDGSNSIPYSSNPPPKAAEALRRAEELIRQKKRRLSCSLSADEMTEYATLKAERQQLLNRIAHRINKYFDNHLAAKKYVYKVFALGRRARRQVSRSRVT